MKKLAILLILIPLLVNAQWVLDNCDTSIEDSLYTLGTEGGDSKITLSINTTDFAEGTGALDVNFVVGAHHPWGSFAQLYYRLDDDATMDWSAYDSISVWIKVRTAPTLPENMFFRFHIVDKITADGNQEDYVWEHATLIDVESEWVNVRIPIIERESDGTTLPNDEGFVITPDNWGNQQNNKTLDRDKVLGFNLAVVTSGWTDPLNLPADSCIVSFDEIKLFGARSVPFIFFNGKTMASNMEAWSWGQSSVSIAEGEGATAGTNAIHWVQGNEWGNGWSGIGWDIDPSFNMGNVWSSDSLKFKMKADAGTGAIRIQLEDNLDGNVAGKRGTVFTPTADGEWHYYAIKLSDMTFQDGTTTFDSTQVFKLGMMGEGSAVAGQNVYIDDLWTGNPVIDVVPPAAPTGVNALADNGFNQIIWVDVAGESEESYSVYASMNPITDVTASGVDKIAANIAENTQSAVHYIYHPLEDLDVTYYYAVICTDNFGNVSDAGLFTSGIQNTAQGIGTISMTPPVNFVADGDFVEWDASGIQPIVLNQETAFACPWNTAVIDDDNDLSGNIYIAVDDTYLYFAADVIDDVYYHSDEGNWYENMDAFEVYIGLYDRRDAKHSTAQTTGSEPDYKFVMTETKIWEEVVLNKDLAQNEENDYFFTDLGGADYVVEYRIALDSLVTDDVPRFQPERGMRVPIELVLHDHDNTGAMEGNLCTSYLNNDNAWQTPTVWFETWIGDTTNTVTSVETMGAGSPVREFTLNQNYPNPFNPVTTIKYTVPSTANVKLSIYNTMGQEVMTLVDEQMNAGTYDVTFDAASFSSGVYFYRLKAGDFTQIKKMIFMK